MKDSLQVLNYCNPQLDPFPQFNLLNFTFLHRIKRVVIEMIPSLSRGTLHICVIQTFVQKVDFIDTMSTIP